MTSAKTSGVVVPRTYGRNVVHACRVARTAVVLVVIVGGVGRANAQSSHPDAGTTSLPFLNLGVGPAGAALSEGLTAWPAGPDAVFWNPAAAAGVLDDPGPVFVAAGSRIFEDLEQTVLTFATRLGAAGVQLQVQYAGVADIPVRTGPTTDPIATTSANDLALGISAAIPLPIGGRLGLTAKGLYEKLDTADAAGAAMDIGFQAPLPVAGGALQIGIAVRNLGRMGRLESERLRLPWSAAVGVALTRPLRAGEWRISAGTDLWRPVDDFARLRGGVEASYDILSLRLGAQAGNGRGAVSAGLGLDLGTWRLDYSYTYDSDPDRRFLGNQQRLGVTLLLAAR